MRKLPTAKRNSIKSKGQAQADNDLLRTDSGGGTFKPDTNGSVNPNGGNETYVKIIEGQSRPPTPTPFPLPEKTMEDIVDPSAPKAEDEANWREKGVYGYGVYAGFVRAAYSSELYWPEVIRIYSKIRRGDPEVGIVRQVWSTFVQNCKGKWIPPDNPTDEEKRAQEFAESIFDDMLGGEQKLLTTLVNNVPFYGWGWWEILPGLRKSGWRAPNPVETWESKYDDGMIGIREIAWRDPTTFWRWEIEHWTQRLLGLWQAAYLSGIPPVFMSVANSLHIRYGDQDNPEGLALLEPIYRLERLKYGYEVTMGIGHEHGAGYLNVLVKKGKITAEDRATINKAARAIMSAQEGNYAAWPENMEGEVKDIPFQNAGMLLETVKYYGTLKLTLFGLQYVVMSTSSGRGSYAAVESSSSMAVEMFNAMMDGFAKQINEQITNKIFKVYNAGRFGKGIRFPTYTIPPLDRTIQLTELAQFLSAVWGNLPLTEDDFQAIRRQSQFLPENLPADDDVIVGKNNTKTGVKENEQKGNLPKVSGNLPPGTTNQPPLTPQQQEQANNIIQQAKAKLSMMRK